MATHAPIMGAPLRAPAIPAPPIAITRILSRFDREQLEGFVAIAIDLMDLADGEPDFEDDDPGEEDDPAGDLASEDVAGGYMAYRPTGPGCPISDPDKGADDEGEQVNEDGLDYTRLVKGRYGMDQSKGPVGRIQ